MCIGCRSLCVHVCGNGIRSRWMNWITNSVSLNKLSWFWQTISFNNWGFNTKRTKPKNRPIRRIRLKFKWSFRLERSLRFLLYVTGRRMYWNCTDSLFYFQKTQSSQRNSIFMKVYFVQISGSTKDSSSPLEIVDYVFCTLTVNSQFQCSRVPISDRCEESSSTKKRSSDQQWARTTHWV